MTGPSYFKDTKAWNLARARWRKVVELWRAGVSHEEIAKRLRLELDAVERFLRAYEEIDEG